MTADADNRIDPVRLIIALLFVLLSSGYVWWQYGHVSLTLVIAAAFGAYMAMNIGANDVANNVGPAVGARAMSLAVAIGIAAVFEAAGAIIAGGEVVGTIKGGIIDPSRIDDARAFVWVMMAALLAAALWLNLATAIGAPVSTTHSIVGAVLGSGIAAAGWDIANWGTVGSIAASWVVSPLLGGLIAALLLYVIKQRITYQTDLVEAARKTVPVLLALMAWSFVTYLCIKGLGALVKMDIGPALGVGAVGAVLTYAWTRMWVVRRAHGLVNDRDSVNGLFTLPLLAAAALLSFAHGSNDVANAIGPLAAIHDALTSQGVHGKVAVPTWVMLLGALGLSVGLALYGPRLIRTVGSEITEIDPMRAWCIAMAATLTVIVASQLGLPISTTHVTIGAVFGVGFLREYLKANYQRIIAEIAAHHAAQETEKHEVEAFFARFEAASREEKSRMLKELKRQGKAGLTPISKPERKELRRFHKQALVKRSIMLKVVAAWIITVPASALMAAAIFLMIRGAQG
ncbi:inorganic phosphate transporter [Pseudomarimonas salicorniae]|uniref:Phosphate transporter n=1 Tax=Pseudomarimonas salicorniae TaxID=2933270 RepID=A0ABT0GK04_9GAMM|nr:inorganic phosphate transporter [Lysobacter sp. CAU 1642]MCK7594345.1 inorganic phosphate transporter [Lysobacter sp. CAU 1642]